MTTNESRSNLRPSFACCVRDQHATIDPKAFGELSNADNGEQRPSRGSAEVGMSNIQCVKFFLSVKVQEKREGVKSFLRPKAEEVERVGAGTTIEEIGSH